MSITPFREATMHVLIPLAPLDEDPVRRHEWHEQAACRDHDTDLFFDPAHERHSDRVRREQAAKKICATCPVQAECLRFAESTPERFGVWGGTTQRERATHRRRGRRAGTLPGSRGPAAGRP
ncbi:WhiB family transcriptional regulator [Catenulispora acidiphila]|nr:WhiB family transcriptional regulator [Catenulispora acidiphila]